MTHVLVWRRGRAVVVTLHLDGRREIAQREFTDEYAAIAHLLQITAAVRVAPDRG